MAKIPTTQQNKPHSAKKREPPGPIMTIEQQQQAQKELWELFGKPPDWTLAKFYLIQQLQAFLIEVFRRFVTPDKPCLKESELYAFVKQHIHNLVRRNGTCYTLKDDIAKTITGTLYGSKFFEKDTQMGTWTINVDKATIWEVSMLNRIDDKKPWNQKANTAVNTNSATSMHFLNKTPVYNKRHVGYTLAQL